MELQCPFLGIRSRVYFADGTYDLVILPLVTWSGWLLPESLLIHKVTIFPFKMIQDFGRTQWILMYWSMKISFCDSEAALREALQMTSCWSEVEYGRGHRHNYMGRLKICSFQLLRLLALCFSAGFIAKVLTERRSEVRKTNCVCIKPLIIITQIIQ